MREYGKVYSTFWTGRARDLSEDGRTLFFYLLTSPHGNAIGCYRLPLAYIADDLAWSHARCKAPCGTPCMAGCHTPTENPLARVIDTLKEVVDKDFVEYDNERSIILIKNWFDYNKIENPSVGKSCVAMVNAIPKESALYQKLIESLKPFAARFEPGDFGGVLHGARQGVGQGVLDCGDRVSDTESRSSSKREVSKKLTAASDTEDTRARSVDSKAKELNFNDFDTAAVVCCQLAGVRMLTPDDQRTLLRWCKDYDMQSLLAFLEKRLVKYAEKHGKPAAHPLTYFNAAVKESAEKGVIARKTE